MQFSPTETSASAVPLIDVTGTTSTLTGPQGNSFSSSFAMAFDSVGNQALFIGNMQLDSKITFSIPIFAPGTNGTLTAPIRNIVGSNTGFPRPSGIIFGNFGNGTAGICFDASDNIYVGFIYDSTPTSKIISFPAGSNGNATGTTIVTTTNFVIQSIAFDKSTNLIWVAGNQYSGGLGNEQIRGYTTAGVLQTTINSSLGLTATQMSVSPNNSLVFSGMPHGLTPGYTLVFPSGMSTPSQTLTVTPASTTVYAGAMDANGLIYTGPVIVSGKSYVEVFAAGATGAATPIRKFHSSLLDTMADNTFTNIQQIVLV